MKNLNQQISLKDVKFNREQLKSTFLFLFKTIQAKNASENQSSSLEARSSSTEYSKFNKIFDYNSFLEEFHCFLNQRYFSAFVLPALNFIVEERLMDCLIPYLKKLRKSRFQPLKVSNQEHGSSPSTQHLIRPYRHKSSTDKKQLNHDGSFSGEIIIHVIDETKNITQDFNCSLPELIREMGYFASLHLLKDQKLQDLDITIHCDIKIFQWLLFWIQMKDETCPRRNLHTMKINVENVIGLMVSAEFLQIPSLVEECLNFTHQHISSIIKESQNLNCLTDTLVSRIAKLFSNADLEKIITKEDVYDRITSRLYIQFIYLLHEIHPDEKIGHYYSASTLFRCSICHKLIINSFASKLPCSEQYMDDWGGIYFKHVPDPKWSFGIFLQELKRELRTWRKVYWKLWGIVTHFLCSTCGTYFPARMLNQCHFHTDAETLQDNWTEGLKILPRSHHKALLRQSYPNQTDNLEDTQFVLKSYKCCNERAFKYQPCLSLHGCTTKDHVPDWHFGYCPENGLEILEAFRFLIVDQNCKNSDEKWSSFGLTSEEATLAILLNEDQGDDALLANQSLALWGANQLKNIYGYDVNYGNIRKAGKEKDLKIPLEIWSWNTDLTTRYNQDMQRETEEKAMLTLAFHLSQNYLK